MSTATFLCLSGVMLGGLVLLWLRYQKLGALALSIAMAAFLAILPWPTLNLLMKENRDIRGFAAPRLDAIRAVWTATSLAFSVTVGLFIALRKPTGKKRDWEAPTSAPGLDEALMRSLARAKEEQRTFIGITQDQREVSLDTIARERHMQIVGPTRSGKSQLLLALTAQDMHAGIPVFLMEAKGDRSDYDQFIKLAELAGRTDSVRYFNPNDIRSMTFNPIRRVPGQDSTAIANQIARAIGREPTSSGEGQDYYRSVDYAKIQNMAEIFCHVGLQFTLRDCFYYFSSQDAREAVFEMCPDRRLVGTAIDGFEKNEDSSALCSAFQPWTTGRLGELLNTYSPQIKLEDIFAGNQLAYFAIPVGQLQVLANPLGRMVIAGLLSLASSRQKAEPKPGPASIILDEFAEFATPVFASFIATVGSAKLWTILSHQDLGQLKKVQGMDADAFASAVFNNTSGCKICFRAPDPEDAEFWSSTLGTFSTSDDTERISRGFLGEQKTGEMSRRMVEQFKIHPNRIKNLAPGTALIFAPGQEDCLVKTARVHELLKNTRAPLFGVPTESGLDLASVVDDPGAAKKQDHRGKVKA